MSFITDAIDSITGNGLNDWQAYVPSSPKVMGIPTIQNVPRLPAIKGAPDMSGMIRKQQSPPPLPGNIPDSNGDFGTGSSGPWGEGYDPTNIDHSGEFNPPTVEDTGPDILGLKGIMRDLNTWLYSTGKTVLAWGVVIILGLLGLWLIVKP